MVVWHLNLSLWSVPNHNWLRFTDICVAWSAPRGEDTARSQWWRRIWIRGSVWLVTERCSTSNPVVRLANGIRGLCVRETEARDDREALHSWLYLTFSLHLKSSRWQRPTKSRLLHRQSCVCFDHFESLILLDWVSQLYDYIWIFLKQKKEFFSASLKTNWSI